MYFSSEHGTGASRRSASYYASEAPAVNARSLPLAQIDPATANAQDDIVTFVPLSAPLRINARDDVTVIQAPPLFVSTYNSFYRHGRRISPPHSLVCVSIL